jgi:NAD-dependent dihydropyrimidine dehydrogenase PreA subunit
MKSQSPWVLPIIDLRRCSGCGLCEQLCPTQAVEVLGGRAEIVRPDQCTFCDICESYCPEGAIGRPFQVMFGPALLDVAEARGGGC